MDAPSFRAPRKFIARQPILNADAEAVGYELLFRSGPANAFGKKDGSAATAQVIANGLITFGLERFTGSKPAYINVTPDVLACDLVRLFEPGQVVVEILEDVEPTGFVLGAIRDLRGQGYVVALDDVVELSRIEAFRGNFDLAKVDFRATTPPVQGTLAAAPRDLGLQALAEKVEDHEDVRRAKAQGYTLFQGDYFAKPEMLSASSLTPGKVQVLQLLRELNREELDVDRVERVLRSDVALSYRLLRIVNSAANGLRRRVDSIGNALRLLGVLKVRRWATLVALESIGEEKPRELLLTGLIRARFCENVARPAGAGDQSDTMYLVGLFSVIEGLTDAPLSAVLEALSLSPEVDRALVEREGKAGAALSLILSYEAADWEGISRHAAQLGISEDESSDAYEEALTFADSSWGKAPRTA